MKDIREVKQTNPASPEELASQVSEKVSQHLLDEAYSLLKTGVQADFANKNATERNASWAVISGKLNENGSLSKLSAEFLKDISTDVDRNNDGKVQLNELSGVAQNARNPFYKGMAQEAVKSFDIAASLHQDDKAIDKFELSSFAKRQYMPAREQFVDSVIAGTMAKLVNDTPSKAYEFLWNSVSARSGMETPTERLETWGKIAEQLAARDLTPKLSMAFLTHTNQYLDGDKNGSISKAEISKFTQSRSPIMREFTQYLTKEFDNIASVDYDYNQISQREKAVYESKMNDH
jgi:Ca2+-binding EF-hand superfamily protein